MRRELEEERRLREKRDIPVERWIHRPGTDQCYDMKNLVSDGNNFKNITRDSLGIHCRSQKTGGSVAP